MPPGRRVSFNSILGHGRKVWKASVSALARRGDGTELSVAHERLDFLLRRAVGDDCLYPRCIAAEWYMLDTLVKHHACQKNLLRPTLLLDDREIYDRAAELTRHVSLRFAAIVRQKPGWAFGKLDCVINNAGVGDRVELSKLDGTAFDATLSANLTSAFLVSQAAIPHLKVRGGRLIFMSSGAARTGGVISAAYAASKAGLEGLMHYYATYLRPHRITANAIAPSLIATNMFGEMQSHAMDQLPLGRLGRPDEIWPAVRMIMETEYLTGQTIHIDAGRHMT